MLMDTLAPWHGASSDCRWRSRPPDMQDKVRVYRLRSCGQPTRDDAPAWGFGGRL